MKQWEKLHEKMIASLFTSPQRKREPTLLEDALLIVLIAFLALVMLEGTDAAQVRLFPDQQSTRVVTVFWVMVMGGLWVALPRLIIKVATLVIYCRSRLSR